MLETELSTFYKHAQQLRKENPAGGFAVIKDDIIFPEIYSNYSDAKRNGNRFFGNNNFLIKAINEEEPDSHTFEIPYKKGSHIVEALSDKSEC